MNALHLLTHCTTCTFLCKHNIAQPKHFVLAGVSKIKVELGLVFLPQDKAKIKNPVWLDSSCPISCLRQSALAAGHCPEATVQFEPVRGKSAESRKSQHLAYKHSLACEGAVRLKTPGPAPSYTQLRNERTGITSLTFLLHTIQLLSVLIQPRQNRRWGLPHSLASWVKLQSLQGLYFHVPEAIEIVLAKYQKDSLALDWRANTPAVGAGPAHFKLPLATLLTSKLVAAATHVTLFSPTLLQWKHPVGLLQEFHD